MEEIKIGSKVKFPNGDPHPEMTVIDKWDVNNQFDILCTWTGSDGKKREQTFKTWDVVLSKPNMLEEKQLTAEQILMKNVPLSSQHMGLTCSCRDAENAIKEYGRNVAQLIVNEAKRRAENCFDIAPEIFDINVEEYIK